MGRLQVYKAFYELGQHGGQESKLDYVFFKDLWTIHGQ